MAERRVAVVTGANRGIGVEIASQLAKAGLRVIATSRGPREGFATLDVTRRDQIDALAANLSAGGGIDVLVNNAGASFNGFDAAVARQTLDTNFYGAMHLTDALLPMMRPAGRVVMVSSGMGALSHVHGAVRALFEDDAMTRSSLVALMQSFVSDVAAGVHEARGWPSNAYSVSKVAMNALVRVLARELDLDPRRILVNAACPGWVRTHMGGQSAPRTVEHGARTPLWLALLPEGGPKG
ncbi:MAG: SDR family NAD(P)-dependent oxidoreductase, partial [Myxococcota bacterium]|nr:SDR family NAD(P)-dependent oxidoreductase [Myxococcota bacterium]